MAASYIQPIVVRPCNRITKRYVLPEIQIYSYMRVDKRFVGIWNFTTFIIIRVIMFHLAATNDYRNRYFERTDEH